jgi:hypothetical protein
VPFQKRPGLGPPSPSEGLEFNLSWPRGGQRDGCHTAGREAPADPVNPVEISYLVADPFPQGPVELSSHFLQDPMEISYLIGAHSLEVSGHFLHDPLEISHFLGNHLIFS